jgi:hypothetical protein
MNADQKAAKTLDKHLDFSGGGRIKVNIRMLMQSAGFKRQLAGCKALRTFLEQTK